MTNYTTQCHNLQGLSATIVTLHKILNFTETNTPASRRNLSKIVECFDELKKIYNKKQKFIIKNICTDDEASSPESGCILIWIRFIFYLLKILKHFFCRNAISTRWVIEKNVSNCSDNFPILYNWAAAHPLNNTTCF